MVNTRPSRQKACVQGEEATILTGAPSSGSHPHGLASPPAGFLRAVPIGGQGCEHPADPPAVHVPGPDPAPRVVG